MHKSLLESPLVTLQNIDLASVASASPDVLLDLVKELHATCIAQSNEIVTLTSQACTDPLTGLLNRRGLDRCLSKMIAQHARNGGAIYVLHIDLDNFKSINDTISHDAGDLALTTVANRLEGMFRGDDIVARLGGDEFLVVLKLSSDESSYESACGVGRRILREISDPMNIGHRTLTVTASIGGIEYVKNAGLDASTLIHMADLTMLDIKRGSKCGVTVRRESQVDYTI